MSSTEIAEFVLAMEMLSESMVKPNVLGGPMYLNECIDTFVKTTISCLVSTAVTMYDPVPILIDPALVVEDRRVVAV